jgi:branched-chain amino acid transport system permease protein
MTQIIIASVITASMYAVMALGVVVVFKTVRVFNFAAGQVAALGGYVGCTAANSWGLPFVLVVVLGAVVGAATSMLIERLVLARLYQRSMLELVVATFAVSLMLQSLTLRVWGDTPRTIAAPFGNRTLSVWSATISIYGLCLVGFAVLVVAALSLVLARSQVGLRLRATFDDPVAARMQGVRIGRVRTASWGVGGAFAGAAGVLITPILFLSQTTMEYFLIVSLAAAVIGGFSSFYGAVAGGLTIALTTDLLAKYVSLSFNDAILYGIIIVLLWVRPYGLFGAPDGDEAVNEGEHAGAIGRRWEDLLVRAAARTSALRQSVLRGHAPQWFTVVGIIAVIWAAPSIFGVTWQLNLMSWLVNMIAVSGLALMMFYSGRIPLAQNAFMAVGGYGTALLLHGHVDSWPLIVVAVTAAAAVAGMIFEWPSQRLEGAYYAVATVALGLAVPLIALNWVSVTGGANGKSVDYIPLASGAGGQWGMYWLLAAVATAVLVVMLALRNSRIGRAVVAVRDSPDGAASLGITAGWRRIALAGVAAGLGGLAGSLGALSTNLVTPDTFSLDVSLSLFVGAVLAGSIAGAAWGAAVITLVPVLLQNEPVYATGAYGAVVLLALFALPRNRDVADVLRRRRPAQVPVPAVTRSSAPAALGSGGGP